MKPVSCKSCGEQNMVFFNIKSRKDEKIDVHCWFCGEDTVTYMSEVRESPLGYDKKMGLVVYRERIKKNAKS